MAETTENGFSRQPILVNGSLLKCSHLSKFSLAYVMKFQAGLLTSGL